MAVSSAHGACKRKKGCERQRCYSWAPVNADPLPSTPRRALSDYVSELDDTSGFGDTSDLDDTTTA